MEFKSLSAAKAVIFDVDGTLYDQGRLRRLMLRDLLLHHALRPWRYRDVLLLKRFREERENHAGAAGDLENEQYRWVAGDDAALTARVRRVVQEWIYTRPKRHLKAVLFPGVAGLFRALREQGRKVAIYSDHHAVDKLKAMGLEVDLVVCSTDREVDRLKPDPKGLHLVADRLGLAVKECLFVGDRQEMDGECAERAGMPYLILDQGRHDGHPFYTRAVEMLLITKQHGTSVDAA